MKVFFYVLLITIISSSNSSLYSNLKGNVLSYFRRSLDNNVIDGPRGDNIKMADEINKIDEYKQDYPEVGDEQLIQIPDKIEPITPNTINARRFQPMRRKSKSSVKDRHSSDSSSTEELKNWKDEWKEHWLEKKFEALNSTVPIGDTVNMVAARPWGVPCGDPNQHDMPWGTCMLPMECDAEYRIYRGDYFCGRTKFVCCGLQLTTYDLYGGFDVSFAGSQFESDTAEKKDSREKKRRKKRREMKKRRNERLKRKRQIKRDIKRITKEITKILNNLYRNGTNARIKKTKRLKKFIKFLKKQFKKDRKSVQDIHHLELAKIDKILQNKLLNIRQVNKNFISNSTFRDIVVNGTVNKDVARMLLQAYPQLANFLQARRGGGGPTKDYLQYDVEYGLLYNQ